LLCCRRRSAFASTPRPTFTTAGPDMASDAAKAMANDAAAVVSVAPAARAAPASGGRKHALPECAQVAGDAPPLPDFSSLPLSGWHPDPTKPPDEHFLDLAYQLARASEAKDGHMGCCVVLRGEIIAMSINCALFGAARSDVHAEAAAISDSARRGVRAKRGPSKTPKQS